MLALLLSFSALGSARTPNRLNVVMVFIDTLRADHVHCLGYPRKTTPALDAVAAGGTLFEEAMAPSSWSLPSYCSILSSLHPPSHAVDEVREHFDSSFITLPKVLATYGYDTAGFVGGAHLNKLFGLDNGFALYRDEPHYGSFFYTVPEALQWLERRGEQPFFAFIQGYDAHAPYQAPLGFDEMFDPNYHGVVHDRKILDAEVLIQISDNVVRLARRAGGDSSIGRPGTASTPGAGIRTASFRSTPLEVGPDSRVEQIALSTADRNHIVAHYDGAVAYADTWLGVLVGELRKRGLLENTLLIVAADHGESLGERGYYGHRLDLNEEQIHVPLVFSGPGIASGRRVSQVVGLVDLAPTVLDLCNIPVCREFQGRSLASLVRKDAPTPATDAEQAAYSSLRDCLSVRTSKWHLLAFSSGKTRLFDAKADPAERTDLSKQEPEVTQKLRGQVLDWFESHRRDPRGDHVVLTPEEKAMFRQRGYW